MLFHCACKQRHGECWFGERVVILNYDAGEVLAETERMACEAANSRCLPQHPPAAAAPNRCAAWGELLVDNSILLAVLDRHGNNV